MRIVHVPDGTKITPEIKREVEELIFSGSTITQVCHGPQRRVEGTFTRAYYAALSEEEQFAFIQAATNHCEEIRKKYPLL